MNVMHHLEDIFARKANRRAGDPGGCLPVAAVVPLTIAALSWLAYRIRRSS